MPLWKSLSLLSWRVEQLELEFLYVQQPGDKLVFRLPPAEIVTKTTATQEPLREHKKSFHCDFSRSILKSSLSLFRKLWTPQKLPSSELLWGKSV